jgi:hypothetical protein
MRKPEKGTGLARGLMVAAAVVLLAGCGSDKKAAGSAVEMRDMDVVDGTANDSMTDLDAVRSDGVGVGSNSGNQVAPTEKAKSGKPEAAGTESEDVPAE